MPPKSRHKDETPILPEVFVFENADKDHWQCNDDAKTNIGFRRGSRVMLCGGPNQGKSNICFNKITDSEPPYDLIYIYQASDRSKEYNSINYIRLTSIFDLPEQNEIPEDKKILVVFEDLDTLSERELKVLDVWFRFSCSHLGVCCVLICQNFFSIPVKLRRKLDCWTLFLHGYDKLCLKHIPIPKEDREAIIRYFDRHGENHMFITIDLAAEDRYVINNRLVLNG